MRSFLIFFAVLFSIFVFSCNNTTSSPEVQSASTTDTTTVDGHPSWIEQGNIYEVNVRQYTAEGTFNAFAKHLHRLKDMGVQTLWF
ncbi:MAG: hypothetical protein ACJ749_09205, partial [Flavisolibacter sp.]